MLFILSCSAYGQDYQNVSFPDSVKYKVQPYYKYRADGKPGRAVVMKFTGSKLYDAVKLRINAGKIRETIQIPANTIGADSIEILLPPDIGVKQESKISLTLQHKKGKLMQTIQVQPMRHWTVYVYPHSHVDIGYSNTQANVEFIHKRNIDQGIKLAEATKDYPEGARYRWNTEVMWPYERYMLSASPVQKERVRKAIIAGQLCLDAGYVNINTSLCGEEEMFQFLRQGFETGRQTGKPSDVLVQTDIPGMSWGMVPVLAHGGVRYVMSMINEDDKGSHSGITQKPFWWIGPDGKSRVLFLTPGNYTAGVGGKGRSTGRPWFGQLDTAKIPEIIKTNNPRALFLDNYLFANLPLLEKNDHPYDIYVVTWALWDNALIDADLPDAVKSWNEEYAYPHLIIAGAHEIMETFEKKYGSQLPIVKGDDTESWTDGPGSAARESKLNRNAKERLLQAETIWTMLHSGQPAPRAEFDEAWRYTMLGTEHTWAYEIPQQSLFQNKLWKEKQKYIREADERSSTALFEALIPATDKSDGCLGPEYGPANGGVAVLNTLSWPRGGLVTLSGEESSFGDRVIDDQGKEVLAQRLLTGELVFLANDIPGFGSRHYSVIKGKCSLTGTCSLTNNTLDNGLIKAEIDPANGNIKSLVEISSGYDFSDMKINGGLNAFRYQPASGNARPDTNIVISIRESGPLVAELQVSSLASGCRSVTRSIRLVHGQPWVEISNIVDKLPLLAKDGVHFGFGFNVPEGKTHVDIPWGVMRVEDDQWESANRSFLAMQHWLDVSNEIRGVTWCSPDAPLYESGGITAKNRDKESMGITKLPQSSTIYSYVMNNHWPTNWPLTQDGPVQFRYWILPHGSYNASKANRFGVEQAQPLVAVSASTNPIVKPLIELINDKVAAIILRTSADGKSMIVRLRSLSDNDENVKLSWPSRKPASVFVCDKGEDPGEKEVTGEVTVPAMGIVTLRAEW